MNVLSSVSILFLISSFLVNCALHAQENSNESIKLSTIHLVYENFKTVDKAFVLSHIRLREGSDYSRFLSDQSLRSLYDTNYFEYIDFRLSKVNNLYELTIHLTAKYKLKDIEFTGNQKFSTTRLIADTDLKEIRILDEYKIDAAAKKVSKLYFEKGFKDAKISYDIIRDDFKGEASVKFKINESVKSQIKLISFTGSKSFSDRDLIKVMKTKRKDFFSWLSGSGNFDKSTFEKDLEQLRIFYQNAGFLDVNINSELVKYDFSNPKNSTIDITIEEGERYSLGAVKTSGETIFTTHELLGLISKSKKAMRFYSPVLVDSWAKVIQDYYASSGYLETRVYAQKKSNLENRQIDVNLIINESEKYYLESIRIEGNTKTQQKVIIRELALKPGDVFDYKRMESSEKRLKNTAFFDEVRLKPESTNIPGRKNLNVFVKESRTGSFSFGAGFGSVRSSQFFLEMKQSNFDINDFESGFQGAGQKFRARISIGSKSNQALIGFEEPWLFEQRLTFGTNLYATESEYHSSYYNESRTGIEFYIRRRLFELLETKISYKNELVDIYDVTYNFEDLFDANVGEQRVSKIGLSLLRDNRDSFLFTRSGNRTSIDSEFAGLGGDVDYLKVDLRTAEFIPTIDQWRQSLSIIGRLGMIIPLRDDDKAPFYDRFYLGGPETLRGYDYRDIGPRHSSVKQGNSNLGTAGGHTYGLISSEYLFQVSNGLGLVVFYDGGFVNDKENDFSLDEYADNIGIGARLLMMGSPLKLDYGIPLNVPEYLESSSNSPQFHFSFGTRY